MAESKLENLITNATMDPEEKLVEIRNSIRMCTEASLDMSTWESFVSSNIIIPTPQTEGESMNKPLGENKH